MQGCHNSDKPIAVVPELKNKKYVKNSKATYDH